MAQDLALLDGRPATEPAEEKPRAPVTKDWHKDVLSAALVVMLDKIREHEDETKGAALAARFEKGR